jgi:hypothetical protein
VSTSGITSDDSCPLPGVDDPDETPERTISIESVGSQDWTTYEFTVSGALEKGDDANSSDTVDGSTANGGVGSGGYDNYLFDGEVTAVEVTKGSPDDIQMFVDGTEYELGDGYDHTAEIESVGSEDYVSYEFTVSGAMEKGEKAGSSDSVDGSTASGAVASGGSDTYLFDGAVEEFSVTKGEVDDVALFVDGDEVTLDDTETLMVRSVGSEDYVGYEFDVSGSLEKGTYAGGSDTVDGSTADGAVAGGGQDSYEITGEVTDVRITHGDVDDVALSVDGTDIPISETVEVRSVGSEDYVAYQFSVDGELEKGRKAGASDTVDGSTADGAVAGGGTDSYQMVGSVSGFTIDSGSSDDVALYVDGDRLY